MDNVTHSLAGLLLAESALRLRAHRSGVEPSARYRVVAALSSMVAANLPDADLFYTGVGADRLVYLLHHRGHTHTVPIAVVGAALLWAIAWLIWRWRARAAPPRADATWLFGLLLVSTLSHLVLDWTNSYGVHPFWPFDNRWRYGDAVFIVEPWFWVIAVPTLFLASTRRVARGLLALVLMLGLVLAWRVHQVTTGAALALTAGAVASVVIARALPRGTRAATAVAAWVALTLIMGAGSARARATALRAVRDADPSAEVLDVIVTPLPANPLCTTIITVERSGPIYRVATARIRGTASLGHVSRCGARDGTGPMFRVSPRTSTRTVQWDTEWTAPHAELTALARESCPALAALRFMRVPAWRALDDSTLMLGDVRYGDGSGSGFADVRVPRRSTACPDAVPPWTPPRAELLGL
ncbi:MAG TPA: metal-dependent hydrolase [Gemmatimonadaceae bacterium]|nr:metal-dependent hydrolase [Gemmatimonadaceae bacterium]